MRSRADVTGVSLLPQLRYPTLTQLVASAGALAAHRPGLCTMKQVGVSRAGRPLHLLSVGHARRTVLVAPWAKGDERVSLYSSKSTNSRAVAELQSGVLGNVVACDGSWCELSVEDYSGYAQQDQLWGVYRGEEIK